MAKNKWTEYIIEYLQWITKQPYKKPQFFVNDAGGPTIVIKNAWRYPTLRAAQVCQRTFLRNYIRTRIIPVNCELGESHG